MPIIITDDDAMRLLSISEAIEGMRVAFTDLANGKAVNPPRLRYKTGTKDPRRSYSPTSMQAPCRATMPPACARARTSC